MPRFSKFLGTAATVTALLLAATAAQATPYVSGSFGIITGTSTTSNVTTTTSFATSNVITTTATGSFSDLGVALPATLPTGGALNFGAVTGFNFSNAGIGSFAASTDSSSNIQNGVNASIQWNVVGTYTVGADWSNAGDTLTGNETWTCNQTGGPGNAITCSGTFHAPAVIQTPEPVTLSLFGAGLAGVAAFRRRRSKAQKIA